MKGHGILLIVMVFAFGSLLAAGLCVGKMAYQETTVTIDQGIQGIVLEPEVNSPVPAVLILTHLTAVLIRLALMTRQPQLQLR